MTAPEFHDLAEAALNHESGGATCWGNLGYWAHAGTYPDACTALADELATALQLDAQTRLIDVGFGCGDQLLHWRRRHGVRHIAGLNLSHSQTAFARQRLIDAGHADIAARIRQGDASELPSWAGAQAAATSAADTILALDCAYHFGSRPNFIADAARVLRSGGRLGVTDILLGRPRLKLREYAALHVISKLSHLPWQNLQAEDHYRRAWHAAGFELDTWSDITDQVFEPFGAWLGRYRAGLRPEVARRIRWTKYQGTAGFLRWAARNGVLRYVVCVGRKR